MAAMSLGVKLGKKDWYPPDKGVYRLDVDAAVKEDAGRFGVGAVVRDHEGVFRAALAKTTLPPSSILDAEINAILYGVGLCLQEGLFPCVVFSDSLLAIRLLANEDEGMEFMEKEIPPVADVVKSGGILSFQHMLREANRVAHNLAQFGAGCNDFCIWTRDFPPWLTESG